jgi:hypothetical protein
MGNHAHDGKMARMPLLGIQMFTWGFIVRLILLAKSRWKRILSYQALPNHPSLPLDVEQSEHTMMIAVCPMR